jgi:hypothetical protein
METEYWRRLAMQTMRKKEAATAAARKWRGVAAELQTQIEYWKEPVTYRFRGCNSECVWERDVMRVPADAMDDLIAMKPGVKDWFTIRDRDLVFMLCPVDAVATTSDDLIWDTEP